MFDFLKKFTHNKTEVAVVAIAKDEAPYLHEWLHHYIYFGFAKIVVGVNRTSDLSTDIIRKISLKYPHVSYTTMDWIDQGVIANKNSQFQALSYACLSNKIKTEYPSITHVLYVDIDEFWFPKNFDMKINEYLNTLPAFDILSFNWLWQNGDENHFQAPFENLKITPDVHMKSLVAIKSIDRIVEYRCHAPRFENKKPPIVHIDPSGEPMRYGKLDQHFADSPSLDLNAFVLHRVCRSSDEYVALLMRLRPGVEVPFKNNRFGFSHAYKSELIINHQELSLYWESLNKFIEECKILNLLKKSRQSILKKAERVVNINAVELARHLVSYINILKGTTQRYKLIKILESAHRFSTENEFSKTFYHAADIFAKEGNIEQAFAFSRLATTANSNDETINKQFVDFQNRLKGTAS